MTVTSPVSGFTILLYHGVSRCHHRGIENCSRKHISADRFDEEMQLLATTGRVGALTELLADLEQGRSVAGRVAVTFDDGFENNYSVAFPILQRHGVPATFFLTTGFIGSSRVFWVDKLEYLLNETHAEIIAVTTMGREFDLTSPDARQTTLTEIKRALKRQPALVDATIADIERSAGVVPHYDYADYRMMSWDQVRDMHRSGLCAFGPHTVDHTILSHVSRPEKERQVRESKARLEHELSAPVTVFAYPEGQQDHFDDDVVDIVRRAGFSAAVSAIFGCNTTGTSRYHLHRNMVEFAAPFDACLRGVA